MTLSTFILLYNLPHHPSLEMFSSSLTETLYPLSNSPLPHTPIPWHTPFYFTSLWIWLSLGTSYNQNQSIWHLVTQDFWTPSNVWVFSTSSLTPQPLCPTIWVNPGTIYLKSVLDMQVKCSVPQDCTSFLVLGASMSSGVTCASYTLIIDQSSHDHSLSLMSF